MSLRQSNPAIGENKTGTRSHVYFCLWLIYHTQRDSDERRQLGQPSDGAADTERVHCSPTGPMQLAKDEWLMSRLWGRWQHSECRASRGNSACSAHVAHQTAHRDSTVWQMKVHWCRLEALSPVADFYAIRSAFVSFLWNLSMFAVS